MGISQDGNGFGEVLFVTVLATAIGGGLLWVAGAMLGFVRSMSVRGNPVYKRYLTGLGQLSASQQDLRGALESG